MESAPTSVWNLHGVFVKKGETDAQTEWYEDKKNGF